MNKPSFMSKMNLSSLDAKPNVKKIRKDRKENKTNDQEKMQIFSAN